MSARKRFMAESRLAHAQGSAMLSHSVTTKVLTPKCSTCLYRERVRPARQTEVGHLQETWHPPPPAQRSAPGNASSLVASSQVGSPCGPRVRAQELSQWFSAVLENLSRLCPLLPYWFKGGPTSEAAATTLHIHPLHPSPSPMPCWCVLTPTLKPPREAQGHEAREPLVRGK